MSARARLRSLGETKTVPKTLFNENLTLINKDLFWQARTRGKENQYKYAWVKGGKVFARKQEGSRLVRILHVDNLNKIAQQYGYVVLRVLRFFLVS